MAFSGPWVKDPSSCPKAIVVLFHGYGANGNNLLPLAEALQGKAQREALDVAFWLPNAPHVCESTSQGRQWFSLKSIDLSSPLCMRTEGFRAQLRHAGQWGDQAIEKEIPQHFHAFSGPIFIGGFSQGAAVAYEIGLQNRVVAGVLGFSGFYDLSHGVHFRPPLFWSHGTKDEVVPISAMEHVQAQCLKHHLSLECHAMTDEHHEISLRGIAFAHAFLKKIMASKSKPIYV
jgi:phospholipase/carboxylesterase